MGIEQKSQQEPILGLTGISKQFPAVKALDCVDFQLLAGEVHALMGENGAAVAGALPAFVSKTRVKVGLAALALAV